MHNAPTHQLTQLVNAAVQGDSDAAQRVFAIVYDELRRLAADRLDGDGMARQIQPTTLVHEAYMRLFGTDGEPARAFENRRHFFGAAAESMRQICVDYARRSISRKRGSGRRPLEFDDGLFAGNSHPDRAVEVLAIHEALDKLAAIAPRQAEIVKQRFFAGLTGDEVAEVMGIAPRTVDADWRLAQAWLRRELSR